VASGLTQQAVRLTNIRGGLRRPGLSAEDLAFLQAATLITKAEVDGGELGSHDVVFAPQSQPRALRQSLDIAQLEKGGAPGSAIVVAIGLLPLLAKAGAYSDFSIEGETHLEHSLSFDTAEAVLVPALREQGLHVELSLERAGFGPGTHGKIQMAVEPSSLAPINWSKKGSVTEVGGTISYAGINPDVSERGASVLQNLLNAVVPDAEVIVQEVTAREPGIHVTAWAQFAHGFASGDAAGRKGKRIEAVVEDAVRQLKEYLPGTSTVDPYLADQLLWGCVLADGHSTIATAAVTRRLMTMAWVIKQFMPVPITIRGAEGEPGTVSVAK
jgi:RNA 3'-terminal phosphate cyclase (ATP)